MGCDGYPFVDFKVFIAFFRLRVRNVTSPRLRSLWLKKILNPVCFRTKDFIFQELFRLVQVAPSNFR